LNVRVFTSSRSPHAMSSQLKINR